MSNIWFIYDTIPTTYPQQLNYTTGDGTVGNYEVTEGHAVSLRDTTTFTENDTLIFNLIDIGTTYKTGTYQKIITYIRKITVDVDIVLFVGSANYGSTFDLDSFEHILSFTIRQNTNTTRTSTESLNFNNCANLTSIIPDKLLISQLTANNCSKLTGNLDLQYCSDSLTIVNAGYAPAPPTLGGITSLTFSATQPITSIYVPYTSITNLSLNTTMHTSLLTINVNGCSKLKNDAGDGTQNPLDLSAFNALTTFNADYTLYESIKFGTGISTINMQNCPNLSEISFSTSQISTLNLLNCTLLQSISNLTTTNFSSTPTINLSGTDIDSIIINNLDSTNITYPESMQSLNITNSSQSGILNLSTFTSLSSLSLSTCNSLTGFNIGSSVKTINLNTCTSMTGSYTIPSTVTSCSFTNCGFIDIISNGSSITKIDLQNLPYCESISISNITSAASIFIGGTTSGTFVINNSTFNLESLTLSNCQIPSITLSATEEIITFKTLNLSGSSCSSVTIPLNYFTNISTINFNNCANLNTFNGEQKFIITANDVLNAIDLSGSKLNYIDVHGSYNIQNITFPTTATNIDISGLSKISEFNMSDYQQLEYLEISNTGITSLIGNYTSKPTFEMEIYATHESFSSLTLSNRNIQTIGFNTSGFSNINCNLCSFTGNTLDLATYEGLTNITLTNCGLNTLSINGNATDLDAGNNSFTSISVDNLQSSKLSTINLANCSNFNGFNNTGKISGLPNTVTSLHLGGTNAIEIEYDGSANPLFVELILPNTMQIINLSNCQALSSSINPINMNSLEIFNIHNCNQSNPILFDSTQLREIDISNNNISSISFTSTSTIESMNLENTEIAGNFKQDTYNINLSNLSTLKLTGTNIQNISIPYAENIIGKIINFSLPSSCTSLNISNQDSIDNLSSILGNGTNLETLVANNCNINGNLEINSPSLSSISLHNNPNLSTFDLSNYNNLSSFDLFNTSIIDININSNSTIVKSTYPLSTKNIIFTKAIFNESLQQFTFNSANSPNLESLSLVNTNISNLTCSNCSKLNSIILTPANAKSGEIIENNSLINLTIDTCESLPTLQINNCTALTTASISSCQILESLYLNNCPVLTSLSVNELAELSTLELVDCNIFAGDSLFDVDLMSTLPKLVTLKLTNTRVQKIIINNSPTFNTLTGSLKGTNEDGDTIGVSILNLNGCANFAGITNDSGSIISFVSAIPYAESIDIGNTNISNINCSGILSLTTLILPTIATQINIANCELLNEIDISNCTNLEQLNASSSGIENITTSNIEQTKLKNINMSSTNISNINLDNYAMLETVDLSNTKITSYNTFPSTLETLLLDNTLINILKIPRLENLSELSLKNLNLSILRIDGCINLSNDYLQDVLVLNSAEFINLGSIWPNSIQYIKPKSLIISNTNWSTFSLNGELLNDPETSIDIKANNKLSTLSFLNIPANPTYRNLDISYNTKLKSINNIENIINICNLLNVNLIQFRDIDNYDNLNINLVMNVFAADDTPDLPQYLGIWPQITQWDGMSGKLLGEINFIPALSNKAVIGQFVGIDGKPNIDNLLQFSFNNISVWNSGNYETSEDLSTLTFPNILSLYIADINGDVPDDSVTINDQKLLDIIRSIFERDIKPEMIYTNSNALKVLANEYNIPAQILHTSTENWNPDYPQPNVFKVQFII